MPSFDPFDLPMAAPASLPVTGALVARVEAALIDAACGGESWREIPLQGELVRASQYRAPDVAAAKALLAAHDPARYGGQANAGMGVSVVLVQFGADGQRLPVAGQASTPRRGVPAMAIEGASEKVVGSGTSHPYTESPTKILEKGNSPPEIAAVQDGD